jgi:hypothetical protein
MKKEYVNHMMKMVNSMFMAVDNKVPLGFIFANIYNTRYDNSFIENYLQSFPGDPEKRLGAFLPMLKARHGNYKEHPYFSFMRFFLVNPQLKGRGVGSILFNSFKANCGKEYQKWMSDGISDWSWYLHKGVTMVAAGDSSFMEDPSGEMRYIYINSNDPKKLSAIQKANCFIDFPQDEIKSIQRYLKSNGFATTIRVYNEKDKYTVGYKYLTPWNQLIVITDKKYLKSIEDYKHISDLTADQINEFKKYIKEGIAIYTFELTK